MKEVERFVTVTHAGQSKRYVYASDYDALLVERDELLAALERYLPFIPVTSASEGVAAKYSENVRAADAVRAIIEKCRGDV